MNSQAAESKTDTQSEGNCLGVVNLQRHSQQWNINHIRLYTTASLPYSAINWTQLSRVVPLVHYEFTSRQSRKLTHSLNQTVWGFATSTAATVQTFAVSPFRSNWMPEITSDFYTTASLPYCAINWTQLSRVVPLVHYEFTSRRVEN
ncbi:hypothetical protein F7725_012522 [Dissostichus mawsoni]|uniref:Uncharacterized protein n=1 Tax=Dissostichus mawsoni TaxID=36200 RepID=A0A7J5YMY5_DISMA|nr:hypothetical protein F7725_012522 [Dissostichus mawsoni]